MLRAKALSECVGKGQAQSHSTSGSRAGRNLSGTQRLLQQVSKKQDAGMLQPRTPCQDQVEVRRWGQQLETPGPYREDMPQKPTLCQCSEQWQAPQAPLCCSI